MIITRTPFRVSFAGGSTDIPEFYSREIGAVVSTAINKYMYIMVNKPFDNIVRVCYSQTEVVTSADEVRHPLVREALKLVGITDGIEIVSMADIPAGSGLGSSSSFTVGLLNALYAYTGHLKSAEELAQTACHIEINLIKEPIGKQDQYIAAYGGFRYFQFNRDGTVFTEPIIYSETKQKILSDNLVMFHTGNSRKAGSILSDLKKNIDKKEKIDCLIKMRDMAIGLKNCLNNDCSPDILSEYLRKGWLLKMQLSPVISNDNIDKYYKQAIGSGALSGKILGAGSEGFLLFYCPKEKQPKLIKKMQNLIHTKFSFEPEGSKIIFIS